jgi:hypothetical protein
MVKVGALDYKIEWVGDEWEWSHGKWAECVTDWQIIRITSRMGAHRTACTFAHEVYHALSATYRCFNKVQPEQAADIASYGMVQFWRDNPEAFEWWSALVRGESCE